MTDRLLSLSAYDHLAARMAATGRASVGFIDRPSAGLLLRLDVDLDLAWAAQTAEINKRHGLAATYFVLVGSNLYNAASPASRKALREICDAGQRIGLHYWVTKPDIDVDDLEREFALLQSLAPTVERVVAWHNPQGDLAAYNRAVSARGFVSAYDPKFSGPERYVSDSNLRNLPDAIGSFVEDENRPLVQALLHPLNWVVGGDNMVHILERTFVKKAEQTLQEFKGNQVWSAGGGNKVLAAIRALKDQIS